MSISGLGAFGGQVVTQDCVKMKNNTKNISLNYCNSQNQTISTSLEQLCLMVCTFNILKVTVYSNFYFLTIYL